MRFSIRKMYTQYRTL